MKVCNRSLLVVLLLVASGCDSQLSEPEGKTILAQSGEQINRYHAPAEVKKGGEIFQRYCAQCHGTDGEGDPEWRKRDEDGMFPPPPLNGTGHAWHHPMAFLRDRIKNGSATGQGKMPAQGDKLNNSEIDAVITWFQSQWPDQVYGAWYDIEQRSK